MTSFYKMNNDHIGKKCRSDEVTKSRSKTIVNKPNDFLLYNNSLILDEDVDPNDDMQKIITSLKDDANRLNDTKTCN